MLAVTQGEPAGIGPDIILSSWLGRREQSLPEFLVVGDADCLEQRAHLLGLSVPVAVVRSASEAMACFDEALPVFETENRVTSGIPGQPDEADAACVIEAIEIAVALEERGEVTAVVTAPIQKSSLYSAGFHHPGHTEFLGALGTKRTGQPCEPVMMLAGPDLRTVPVTVHNALSEVPSLLTQERLETVARIVAQDLSERFGLARPRLACAGLNPHAGEARSMGHEDEDIITPVVERLQKDGLDIRGPLPADTMFHAAARKTYDAALAMYHDQALIPVKTLAFDSTVNVTLGLPFVRTSPDHGTALDIAGSGHANPESFQEALKLAHQLSSAGSE
ncbi:4-hydroxythreonine-4-phosphate dehydrogenase PdxA [Coralliovum pocilloporae]|uniref:4-hydroxythreonine-4-phosphate dehydrogenase PdxA n=1 Tax=Coralliovum pocilloporae TaxID=3066369 RepID=UPI00330729D7